MAASFTCRGDSTTVEHLKNIVNSLQVDARGSYVSWVEERRSDPTLRMMEESLHILKKLVLTYDNQICTIRENLGVPRLTLESLPDEIIAQVCEYTDYDFHALVKFSLISTRIRRVILHTPLLWAKVPLDTRLCAEAIDHIARYSGTLELTAIVHHTVDLPLSPPLYQLACTPLGKAESASLDEIFRHSHRWTHAEFITFDQWASHIARHFSGPNLRSLRTLVVRDEDIDQRGFFYQWTMPRLCDLRCINDVPYSLNAEMLTRCAFELSAHQVSYMLEFLASTPRLKSLIVTVVRHLDTYSDMEDGEHNADLPLLEYLEYATNYPDYNAAQHLGCIACPNLKHLSYTNKDDECYGCLKSFDRFVRHVGIRYPLLKTVELSFHATRTFQQTSVFFEDMLISLPATIEKVRLSICLVELRTSRVLESKTAPRRDVYRNLRELDIESCTSILEDGFYINLANCLSRLGVMLQHFRPSVHLFNKSEGEDVVGGAVKTLRQAGVLISTTGHELISL